MEFTKNVLVTFLTRIFQVLFRLLGGAIAARYLGPSSLGSFSLMQMITGISITLGNLGVNGSVVYYTGKKKEQIYELANNALVLGMLQGAVLVLLTAGTLPLLKSALGMQDIGWPLWLIALAAIPFQLLIANFNALLQGQNLIGQFNRNNMAVALVNFVGIVLFLVIMGRELSGRVLAYTAGSAVGAILAFWAVRDLYRGKIRFDKTLAFKMLKFGSVVNSIAVIQFLNYRLDIFLMGIYCSKAEIGQYFIAVTMGEMLWYLPNAIGIVLFPLISGGENKDSKLTALSARNNLFVMLVISLLVFAGAEWIIKIVFSSAYLPSVWPLRYLLPGIVGFSLAKIISPDLIARGKARFVAVTAIVTLVVNVLLNLLLIPRYGACGAALASSVSYLAGIVMAVNIFCKITGIKLRDVLLINHRDIQGYIDFIKNYLSALDAYIKKESVYIRLKRIFDLIFSMIALAFLLPLLLIIAMAIFLEKGHSVLFIQERAGLNGRPFKIIKFKTMLEGPVDNEAAKITRIGRFLRASSLDELPQLINVIKGEMSLVGPRPTLLYQVDKYSRRQKKRLNVLPGMTGWTQVNRGESFSWNKRIEMDLWYIQNRSFWLDLKIIRLTLGVMLRKRLAYVDQKKDTIVSFTDEKTCAGGKVLKKLVVIGAGGFGREVVQLALQQNSAGEQWEVLGFVDDNPDLQGKSISGYPVLGNLDWLTSNAEDKYAVIALGEPELKKKVDARLQDSAIQYATLIHPNAVIGDTVEIGEGSIITAGVILTVDIKVGRHVIINANSCAGHDAVINDYVTIAGCVNIMGEVRIGEGSYVASGVTIRDNVGIGKNSIIGLGAVVVGELGDNVVAVGIPAKVVRENKTGKVFK